MMGSMAGLISVGCVGLMTLKYKGGEVKVLVPSEVLRQSYRNRPQRAETRDRGLTSGKQNADGGLQQIRLRSGPGGANATVWTAISSVKTNFS